MRKINCIVADDEVLARNVILNHLGMLGNINILATCATGLQAYDAIKGFDVDLLFLDIQMPNLTGIDLLRTIKNPPAVIITTAYSEYAIEGYELDVIDYLLKPITFERLLKAIDKFETRSNPDYKRQQNFKAENPSFNDAFIYVKSDKKMVRIPLIDIIYIEGLKDYVKVHTTNSQIVTYKTMTYFEEKLPATQFMRVHRSFIVSLSHITAYTAAEITMGGDTISIGSTYLKEVSRKLNTIIG
ncbi:two component transcriptional regulator, LytTR family [Mucilaginibacter lappiensis]|uniref:DNA-binding LytR/AlgR family response regulator n=1 Tax=Mucilaginibacter lappiensis TaxID=354630 RepID=A0ABR6PD10_9SPHI|nr:LytTR family DNA-binding domain-containing protein [Mucilaginibacter lappiensis]MBB6107637.1 DNA-binding LytR/AlgR family response regulator [Mucilaginibacter lappiensis]SIQ02083.1 two component transcriptional regulator, LytTR family [Mucilaginibacter lappiensis]